MHAVHASKPHDPFSDLLVNARRLGVIGPTAATIMAGSFGWSQGTDMLSRLGLAIFYGSCSIIVGYGLVFLRRAMRTKMVLATRLIGCMVAVALCGEFVAHFGFFAGHRQQASNSATMQNASVARAGNTERDASDNASAIRKQLAAMQLTRSKGEAEAEIQSRKGHKWFAATDSCTAPTGPQTREHCTKYFGAVADVERAVTRAKLEEQLAAADQRLDGARTAAGGVTLAVAHGEAQASIIAAALTQSTTPHPEAIFWVTLGLAAFSAVIAIMFGFLNMVVWEFNENALAGAERQAAAASDAAATARREELAVRATEARTVARGHGAVTPSLLTSEGQRRRIGNPAALKMLTEFMNKPGDRAAA